MESSSLTHLRSESVDAGSKLFDVKSNTELLAIHGPITAVCVDEAKKKVLFAINNVVFASSEMECWASSCKRTCQMLSLPHGAVITCLAVYQAKMLFIAAADRVFLTRLDHSITNHNEVDSNTNKNVLQILETQGSRILQIRVFDREQRVVVLSSSNAIYVFDMKSLLSKYKSIAREVNSNDVEKSKLAEYSTQWCRTYYGPEQGIVLASDCLVTPAHSLTKDDGQVTKLTDMHVFSATYTGHVHHWVCTTSGNKMERNGDDEKCIDHEQKGNEMLLSKTMTYTSDGKSVSREYVMLPSIAAHAAGCAIFAIKCILVEQLELLHPEKEEAWSSQLEECVKRENKNEEKLCTLLLATCGDDRTASVYKTVWSRQYGEAMEEWQCIWRGSGSDFATARVFSVDLFAAQYSKSENNTSETTITNNNFNACNKINEEDESNKVPSATACSLSVWCAVGCEDGSVQVVRLKVDPEWEERESNQRSKINKNNLAVTFCRRNQHSGHGVFLIRFALSELCYEESIANNTSNSNQKQDTLYRLCLLSAGFDGTLAFHCVETAYIYSRMESSSSLPMMILASESAKRQAPTSMRVNVINMRDGKSIENKKLEHNLAVKSRESMPKEQVRCVTIDATGHMLICTSTRLFVSVVWDERYSHATLKEKIENTITGDINCNDKTIFVIDWWSQWVHNCRNKSHNINEYSALSFREDITQVQLSKQEHHLKDIKNLPVLLSSHVLESAYHQASSSIALIALRDGTLLAIPYNVSSHSSSTSASQTRGCDKLSCLFELTCNTHVDCKSNVVKIITISVASHKITSAEHNQRKHDCFMLACMHANRNTSLYRVIVSYSNSCSGGENDDDVINSVNAQLVAHFTNGFGIDLTASVLFWHSNVDSKNYTDRRNDDHTFLWIVQANKKSECCVALWCLENKTNNESSNCKNDILTSESFIKIISSSLPAVQKEEKECSSLHSCNTISCTVSGAESITAKSRMRHNSVDANAITLIHVANHSICQERLLLTLIRANGEFATITLSVHDMYNKYVTHNSVQIDNSNDKSNMLTSQTNVSASSSINNDMSAKNAEPFNHLDYRITSYAWLRFPFHVTNILAFSHYLMVAQFGTSVMVYARDKLHPNWFLVDCYDNIKAPRLLTARVVSPNKCVLNQQEEEEEECIESSETKACSKLERENIEVQKAIFVHCSDGVHAERYEYVHSTLQQQIASCSNHSILTTAAATAVENTRVLYGGLVQGTDYCCSLYLPAPFNCFIHGNEDSILTIHPVPSAASQEQKNKQSYSFTELLPATSFRGPHHTNILAMCLLPSSPSSSIDINEQQHHKEELYFVTVGGEATIVVWRCACYGVCEVVAVTNNNCVSINTHSSNDVNVHNVHSSKNNSKHKVTEKSKPRFLSVCALDSHTCAVGSSDGKVYVYKSHSDPCHTKKCNFTNMHESTSSCCLLECIGACKANAEHTRPVFAITSLLSNQDIYFPAQITKESKGCVQYFYVLTGDSNGVASIIAITINTSQNINNMKSDTTLTNTNYTNTANTSLSVLVTMQVERSALNVFSVAHLIECKSQNNNMPKLEKHHNYTNNYNHDQCNSRSVLCHQFHVLAGHDSGIVYLLEINHFIRSRLPDTSSREYKSMSLVPSTCFHQEEEEECCEIWEIVRLAKCEVGITEMRGLCWSEHEQFIYALCEERLTCLHIYSNRDNDSTNNENNMYNNQECKCDGNTMECTNAYRFVKLHERPNNVRCVSGMACAIDAKSVDKAIIAVVGQGVEVITTEVKELNFS